MTLARIFIAAAAAVLLAALGAGFSILGTPAHQRRLSEDTKRVSDLSAIATYLRSHNTTPPPQLASSVPATLAFEKVVSTTSYEYRRVDSHHFELCTVFAEQSSDDRATSGYSHSPGHVCYRYSIQKKGPSPDGAPIL